MRAWTIVLFILSIHAVLAIFTVGGVGNGIMGYTYDTSGHQAVFTPIPGNYNTTLPSSDPRFFNSSSNTSQGNATLIKSGDFIGEWIESIIGVGTSFTKLMGTFTAAVFSIYTLSAPYFGNFNAMVLEGLVDIVLAIAFFQMVTGRSFKTME